MDIELLQERLVELNAESQELTTKAKAENRDLSADEERHLGGLLDEFDRVKERLDQALRLRDQGDLLKTGSGRKTAPEKPGAKVVPIEEEVETLSSPPQPRGRNLPSTGRLPAEYQRERKGGFATLGHMAQAVHSACVSKGAAVDARLMKIQELAAASTYGSEAIGSDGGFAVPPDFRTAIMEAVMAEDTLFTRCEIQPVSGNSYTFPRDMTTPWQTSGGILAYWDGEAAAATQSKPSLEETTVKLNKCRALVPMTEELLQDAVAMDAYLRRKAPAKIAHKVDLAILQGNGVGQPLGVRVSPAIVSVAKESSQTADTLIANNIIKMYSRMYAPCRSKAVWVINQDIEPQLLRLSMPGTDAVGNTTNSFGLGVYTPANGFASSPFSTLFGRAVIPHQACETLGDEGDIYFIDFTQYLVLLKSGPNPRVETSMHLWFDQDLTAFKFVLRVGGLPLWSSTISARDGSNTYSPYITLAERA